MEEIKVYDKDGQQVTMLVQWDLDMYLYINEEKLTKAHNVHLFNTENDVAYVVTSTYENGIMSFKVPNRLLFSALPITGYIYITEDNESYRSTFVFTVLVRARAVPSDFAYVNDDSDDYINVEKVLAECIAYAESSAASASESEEWSIISKSWAVGDTGHREGEDTDCSKYYCLESEQAATAAVYSAESAADSRDKAAASEANAATSASESADSATLSESYAVGGTNSRDNEDYDNSKYYWQQCERYAESFSGALRPMGTVTFANLPPISESAPGDMYNISDEFETTNEFEEGAGRTIPLGSNIYLTVNNLWDVLAGSPVTGVKGEKEGSYRRGNVNLTLSNFGIDDIPDRVDYLEAQVVLIETRVAALETKTDDDVTETDIDNIYKNYVPLSNVVYDLESETHSSSKASTISNGASTLASSSSLEDRVEALEAKTNEDVYEIDIVEIFEEVNGLRATTAGPEEVSDNIEASSMDESDAPEENIQSNDDTMDDPFDDDENDPLDDDDDEDWLDDDDEDDKDNNLAQNEDSVIDEDDIENDAD